MNNYYEILDLDIYTTEQEINERIKAELSRWRKRVNAPDPKRQREASERMELLQEAEEVLLDASRRGEYDAALLELLNQQDQQAAAQHNTYEQATYTQTHAANDVNRILEEVDRLIAQNNYADAIIAARKATELDGSNAYAWWKLALAQYYWGNINDAIYEINRAINIQPNESVFYYNAYIFHLDRSDIGFVDRLNLAEEAIEKARVLNPEDPDYIVGAANIAQMRGHTDKGIQLLTGLETRHGLPPNSRNILAQLYYDKGIEHTQLVNYPDGNRLHYFTDKDKTIRAKEYFEEAMRYVQDQHLRQDINKWINLADSAFKYKNNYKILAFLLILGPMFLLGLQGFELFTMLISGGLGYLVWKKGRVPQYELNRKYIKSL